MTPKICDGRILGVGKKKPVRLVSTVVARKSAVQASDLFAFNRPNKTTKPDTIPIRLITTCTSVNVGVDRPKIMTCPPRMRRTLCVRNSEHPSVSARLSEARPQAYTKL